jgi:hypothetical protein
MRVVEQTPDRLVIEIRPVGLMILCVGLFLLFFVLGFGMRLFVPMIAELMGLDSFPGLSNLPHVPGMNALGYASVIPLLVAVFLIKTRRLTLDRQSGEVRVASRGVLGRAEKTYPLADLKGASLAASRSHNSGTTYRAVLNFGAERVDVTPYGTSGSGPARTVEAINAWLGPQVSGLADLTGDQAAAVASALEKLGIKLPR